MNDSVKSLIIFLLGAAVGICLPLIFCVHCRSSVGEVQNDTTYVYEKVPYSRLDLEANRVQLDVPNVKVPNAVIIPADSTTIIYKDSVRYVMLPREYYYTSTEDVEIWHSGIDSTIDSLNVVRKTQEITKTTQTVTNRNTLGISLEMNYSSHPDIPIYLEYSYLLHRNVEVSARLQYDLPSQEIGFGLGAKISIGW